MCKISRNRVVTGPTREQQLLFRSDSVAFAFITGTECSVSRTELQPSPRHCCLSLPLPNTRC